MRKLLLCIFTFTIVVGFFGGCDKKIDYCDYVSENRTGIYLYADDNLSVKIYTGERESPYSADGIKGKLESFTEIFVYFEVNPEEVFITTQNMSGEMNYNSVKNCFYLSEGTQLPRGESVEIELICDKKTATYNATNVVTSDVMSFDVALNCVMEYDSQAFEKLVKNGLFDGEIYIRILYDEGCYYYVGVCDKSGKIKAYLVDGVHGKIIAERETG